MGEQFFALSGVASGGNVVLTWVLPLNQLVGITQIAIQRANFGDTAFTQIGTSSDTTGTFTDTAPEAGEYSYRLAVTVTRGGVDNAGTVEYSNQVDLSTNDSLVLSATTSTPTGPNSGPANQTLVTFSWALGDAGANDDVESLEVQVSLNGGPYRHLKTLNQFQAATFQEQFPNGLGSVSFKAIASLPSATPPYNAPVLVTSNVVTVTL